MKIRIGFVSNSSTTSFAIIGFEVPKEELKSIGEKILTDIFGKNPEDLKNMDAADVDKALWKEGRNTKYYLFIPADMGSIGEVPIFGKKVASWSDDDSEGTKTGLDNLWAELKEFQTKLGLEGEIQLITGLDNSY